MKDKNTEKIKIKWAEIPKLLDHPVVIGRNGFIRPARKGEILKYILGILGIAPALYNIDNGEVTI